MQKPLHLCAALALFLLANCSGRGQLPATSPDAAVSNTLSQTRVDSGAPLISIPQTFGALAYTDQGRKNPSDPVTISMLLRYRNEQQLRQFIASVSGSGSHAFLTPQQFNQTYAASTDQQTAVVSALQAAGFTNVQVSSNRTLVQATAPSKVVESFFSTEMHTVSQGTYGNRYTNLKQASVPSSIAQYVRDVSLSNLVVAKTRSASIVTPAAAACGGQLLVNPGFEQGTTGWAESAPLIVQGSGAYQGSWYAALGGGALNERDVLLQAVTIPAGCPAQLAFYMKITSSEPPTGVSDTFQILVNGTPILSFNNLEATQGYVLIATDVSAYAGQTVNVEWVANHSGSAGYTTFAIDSTSLTLGNGATATPAPTATPSATPAPTSTPTPTVAPTSTPTIISCTGAPPDNGPETDATGDLATAIAHFFDYPVQHGCNGAGYTAAIVIDDPVNTAFVAKYLTAAGITQTGTITNTAVGKGGSGDSTETDLDVQTISGLAPGANIIVYNMGDLSDQNIEAAYNQVVKDDVASVVNSSFGGCEAGDSSFDDTTNEIAEQGAALGIAFFAASGDEGSDECSSGSGGGFNVEGVSAPAGDPYFTSVGGVNFSLNGAGQLVLSAGYAACEGGYNSTNICYGGGGVSTTVAEPSWQSNISGVIGSGRNQPDISMPFSPVSVYTMPVENGKALPAGFYEFLGTSWSSPQAVALFLEANELHATRLGWLNATLYSLFQSTGYTEYFTPCSSGTNGAYSCNATEYNQAAGIGAPKGWALANAL
jgi:hypothetical protein